MNEVGEEEEEGEAREVKVKERGRLGEEEKSENREF